MTTITGGRDQSGCSALAALPKHLTVCILLMLTLLLLTVARPAQALSLREFMNLIPNYLQLTDQRTAVRHQLILFSPFITHTFNAIAEKESEEHANIFLDASVNSIIANPTETESKIYQQLLALPSVAQSVPESPPNLDGYLNYVDTQQKTIIQLMEEKLKTTDVSKFYELWDSELKSLFQHYPLLLIQPSHSTLSLLYQLSLFLSQKAIEIAEIKSVQHQVSLPFTISRTARVFAQFTLDEVKTVIELWLQDPEFTSAAPFILMISGILNPRLLSSQTSHFLSEADGLIPLLQLAYKKSPYARTQQALHFNILANLAVQTFAPRLRSASQDAPECDWPDLTKPSDQAIADETKVERAAEEDIIPLTDEQLIRAELLQKLSAIAFFPEGEPRLALYGSHSLRARLFEHYQKLPTFTPMDWDFKLLKEQSSFVMHKLGFHEQADDLAINIAENKGYEVPLHSGDLFTTLLSMPAPEKKGSNLTGFSILFFHRNNTEDKWQREESFDFTFVDSIPEVSGMHFRGIGLLPVVQFDTILHHFLIILQSQHISMTKQVPRIQEWQRMEDDNPVLKKHPLWLEAFQQASELLSQFERPEQAAYQSYHRCEFCKNILKSPWIAISCGTHYCQECIEQLEEDNGKRKCICDTEDCDVWLEKKDHSLRLDKGLARDLAKYERGTHREEKVPSERPLEVSTEPKTFSAMKPGLGGDNALVVAQSQLGLIYTEQKTVLSKNPKQKGKTKGKKNQGQVHQYHSTIEALNSEMTLFFKELKARYHAEARIDLNNLSGTLDELNDYAARMLEYQTRYDQIKAPTSRAEGTNRKTLESMRQGIRSNLCLQWGYLSVYARRVVTALCPLEGISFAPRALSKAIRWDIISIQLSLFSNEQFQKLMEEHPGYTRKESFEEIHTPLPSLMLDMYSLIYRVYLPAFQQALQSGALSHKGFDMVPLAALLAEILPWSSVILDLDRKIFTQPPKVEQMGIKELNFRAQLQGIIFGQYDRGLQLLLDALTVRETLFNETPSLAMSDNYACIERNLLATVELFTAAFSAIPWDDPSHQSLIKPINELFKSMESTQLVHPDNVELLSRAKLSGEHLKASLVGRETKQEAEKKQRFEDAERARQQLLDDLKAEEDLMALMEAKSSSTTEDRNEAAGTTEPEKTTEEETKTPPPPPKSKLSPQEKTLQKARKAHQQADYHAAVLLYTQLLSRKKLKDENQRPLLMIELIDNRTKQITKKLKESSKLLGLLHSMHDDFEQAVIARHHQMRYRVRFTRDDVIKHIQHFSEVTEGLTQEFQILISEHQETLDRLILNQRQYEPGIQEDVAFHIWQLRQSLDYLLRRQMNIEEGFSDIHAALEFRADWIRSLPHGPHRHPSSSASSGIRVVDLLERLDQLQIQHDSALNRAKSLSKTFVAVKRPPPRYIDAPDYLPPDYLLQAIPGNGECMFTAMAEAINTARGEWAYTALSLRRRLHTLLSQIVELIENSMTAELEDNLAAITGMGFHQTQLALQQHTIQHPTSIHQSAATNLQHYGEVSLANLIPLIEPVSLGGVSVLQSGIHRYGLAMWLKHARLLLRALIRAGIVDLSHWPNYMNILEALESQEAANQMASQLDQEPVPFLLVHTNQNHGALLQHFNLAIHQSRQLDPEHPLPLEGEQTATNQTSGDTTITLPIPLPSKRSSWLINAIGL